MLHFKRSVLINAPVEVVWNFHERPDILKILTPPWQPVQIVRREGGLEVGAISEFRLWLGPFPVRWVARHTACEKNRLFADEQVEGPMVSWTHRHLFAEENGQTKLTDAIDFGLPGGWLAELFLSMWVLSRLEEMFRYRHEVTKRECERD
ncbi:MAG: SRPBCC family protein [Oscillatoria princeps RMCB-10]|jgi:ligand-binding SRPBCC domain-containing protein|nr:SRPBCC family protein [Oscillatoria princeps RMCB-10]